MHGNSLKAMASAIENSQCIIICMSESYEKSNACHHEAEYAYVRQRHILPLVVQSKYKARNWLGFIIGACIYVDFTKHEFDKAFAMLEAEIKDDEKIAQHATTQPVIHSNKQTIESENYDNIIENPLTKPMKKTVESKTQMSTLFENKHVSEWKPEDVLSWCDKNNLPTLSQLLENYDGASLIRLYNMSKTTGDNDTFRLLQDDCQRIAHNGQIKLTLIEFIRFQSELDKRLKMEMTQNDTSRQKESRSSHFCSLL